MLIWKRKRKLFITGCLTCAGIVGSAWGQDPLAKLLECRDVVECRSMLGTALDLLRIKTKIIENLEEQNQVLEKRWADLDGKLKAIAVSVDVIQGKYEFVNREVMAKFDFLEKRSDDRFELLKRTVAHKTPVWERLLTIAASGAAVYTAVRAH